MISKGKRKYLVNAYKWLQFIKHFGEPQPELQGAWERWLANPVDQGPPIRVEFTIQDLSDQLLTPLDGLPLRFLTTEKGPSNDTIII